MGYTGDRLQPLFNPALSRKTARRLTVAGRDKFKAEVVQNTPVDDSPFPSREPGTARRSWKTRPVVPPVRTPGADVYTTGIFTEDKVAEYLEVGTGLYGPHHQEYKIRPKNPEGYLRFYSRKNGKWVFAKEVTHPGIHPQRPLATGAALAEHRMPIVAAPILEAWKVEAETYARLASRVR